MLQRHEATPAISPKKTDSETLLFHATTFQAATHATTMRTPAAKPNPACHFGLTGALCDAGAYYNVGRFSIRSRSNRFPRISADELFMGWLCLPTNNYVR